MIKKRKVVSLILFILSIFALVVPSVEAQGNVGYSVQAELPENQRDAQVSYFDLRVEPNQEQALSVTIFNHGNEEVTVQGDIHNAGTNSNGLVVYEEQEEIDKSLEHPITELVQFEENEWTLPAGESKTVTATLQVPEEEFDGVKLGGFRFTKVPTEEELEEAGMIHNQYSYVIAIQLSQKEEEVVPELVLQNVEPQLVNHRTAVVAEIQNPKSVLMSGLTYHAQVYREDESEPLREVEMTHASFAPNSTMDFVIDWENRALEAGSYRLNLTAADGENTWEWQETFEIREEDEELNVKAVEIEEEPASNWIIVGFILLILVIIALLIYIRRLQNRIE